MSEYQYIRVEARRHDRMGALIDEAMRVETHCRHVEKPRPPIQLYGSVGDLSTALREYVEEPNFYYTADGRLIQRRCRRDARVAMDCVISFPIPCAELAIVDDKMPEVIRPMVDRSLAFLHGEFGANMHFALLHLDESYPHLHAYMIGSCQYIHPGMREEMVNNRRIADGAERRRRHIKGLRDFQDRFYRYVALKFGWQRAGWKRNAKRIQDRRLYLALSAAREIAMRENRRDILDRIDKALGLGDQTSETLPRAREAQ